MLLRVALSPKTKGLAPPLSTRLFLHAAVPHLRFSLSNKSPGSSAKLSLVLQRVGGGEIPLQDGDSLSPAVHSTKQVPLGITELAPYPQPPLYPALRLEAQEETAALVLLRAACCLTPIIYSMKATWTRTRQS